MEHMGLVLNLLSAIGGAPYFKRPNFPQNSQRYGKLGIKATLTRFDKDTILRFQEFEAPHGVSVHNFCSATGVIQR
jgi:hypothetical protein